MLILLFEEDVNKKQEQITLEEDSGSASSKSKKVKEVIPRVTFKEIMREINSKHPLDLFVIMQRSKAKLATKLRKKKYKLRKRKSSE